MPFKYEQSTGAFYRNGVLLAHGYSGNDAGKNDPNAQNIRSFGPIPRGKYTVSLPYYSSTHGPLVLRLSPAISNQMFGRSGFLIHGDSIAHLGEASDGCIILDKATRKAIADLKDFDLEVVSGIPSVVTTSKIDS